MSSKFDRNHFKCEGYFKREGYLKCEGEGSEHAVIAVVETR